MCEVAEKAGTGRSVCFESYGKASLGYVAWDAVLVGQRGASQIAALSSWSLAKGLSNEAKSYEYGVLLVC